jgi:hypothetical protein
VELEKISRRMPATIEQALDFPVVKEVIQAAGIESVTAYIEFELIQLASLVSVGGNLNNAQVPFIAKELVSLFPHETLADFKLCFQRGAIGQYGEIFRLDGIVIRGWMEKYLEEKYELKVRLLMAEKDNFYTPIEKKTDLRNPETHQQWLDKLKEAVGSSIVKRVPDLSEQEKKHEGKEKPKAIAPWNNGLTAVDEHNRMILRRAAAEFYKGRTTFKFPDKPFVVEGHEIMAESESDAIAIYTLATKGV